MDIWSNPQEFPQLRKIPCLNKNRVITLYLNSFLGWTYLPSTEYHPMQYVFVLIHVNIKVFPAEFFKTPKIHPSCTKLRIKLATNLYPSFKTLVIFFLIGSSVSHDHHWPQLTNRSLLYINFEGTCSVRAVFVYTHFSLMNESSGKAAGKQWRSDRQLQ